MHLSYEDLRKAIFPNGEVINAYAKVKGNKKN